MEDDASGLLVLLFPADCFFIFLLFLIFRLTGVINWHWFWIVLPLIIPVILYAILFIIGKIKNIKLKK